MNRIKDYNKLENGIVKWLKERLKETKLKGFVVGVSGGIDSATVSTLAAKTGAPTIVLEMPIKQGNSEVSRAKNHISWLKSNFSNVQSFEISLDFFFTKDIQVNVFSQLMLQIENSIKISCENETKSLAEANSRSRLRMLMLYYVATISKSLVLGTGNKVEDFGIGFFTKYGDGGVDISSIGDLYKTEVRCLAKHMGVLQEIVEAKPTDGLWDDGRTDEDQIGATYENLEWAMEYLWNQNRGVGTTDFDEIRELETNMLYMWSDDEYELQDIEDEYGKDKRIALEILVERYRKNCHKMEPIPIFKVPSSNLSENLT